MSRLRSELTPATSTAGGLPTHRGGIHVVVAHGDTLSGLAGKHYGAQEYWPLIWDYNRAKIGPNPNRIEKGTLLDLPLLSSFSSAQRGDARRRHKSWESFPHGPSEHAHHGPKVRR